ncbi:hypothetical protein SAG0109_00590 [Streptococcus agalactiae BSU108]|nr:hypothetical protein SAG0109_00590 [Streptococcus agalactiae BSU108]
MNKERYESVRITPKLFSAAFMSIIFVSMPKKSTINTSTITVGFPH